MIDKYRQSVRQQHAPQDLIERTVYRVKTKESVANEKRKRLKIRYVLVPAIAVCAMITVVILTTWQTPKFYYTVGSELRLKANAMGNKMEKMTMEDYESYLLFPVSTMIPNGILTDAKIYVQYDDSHTTIVKDQAILCYEWKEHKLIVQLSKTEDITPEVLKGTKETKINTTRYHLLSSENGTKLMASCEVKGIHILYLCNHWTKKEFETFLLANQYSF